MRSTPSAISRAARASTWAAAARRISMPTPSPARACSITSGARAPNSRGEALDGPSHDRMRVGLIRLERALEQRGHPDPPVMGPQDAAQQLAADPGAAAFVGDVQAPAADTILPGFVLGPADRAGTDHHHPAVPPPVRPDAGRMRVGRDHGAPEGELQPLCRREIGGLARPGERQAGGDPGQIARRKAGLLQTGLRGLENGGKTDVESEANVGGAGRGLAQPGSRWRTQSGTTSGPAAVNPEE